MRLLSAISVLLVGFDGTSALPSMAQQTNSATQIDAKVLPLIKNSSETVGIYAINLNTGTSYAFHADDPVPTASTIKLPIMVELFQEAASGRLDWNQKIKLTASEKVGGSGVIRELSDGDDLTIRDLMHLMIVVSDNTATNLLLSRIGGDAVNKSMKQLGLAQTAVMHNIIEPKTIVGTTTPAPITGLTEEGKKPGNAIWDTGRSCPKEMVAILEKLYRGQLVSKSASDEMIAVLKRQQYHEGVGRDMVGTVIASKSGALDHLRSDVAIVYAPQGPVAIAITVNNIPEVNYRVDNPGNLLISSISSIVIRELGSPSGVAAGR